MFKVSKESDQGQFKLNEDDFVQYKLEPDECKQVAKAIFTEPDKHVLEPGSTYASCYYVDGELDCVNIDYDKGTVTLDKDAAGRILGIY